VPSPAALDVAILLEDMLAIFVARNVARQHNGPDEAFASLVEE
jgi:hypothetical protein